MSETESINKCHDCFNSENTCSYSLYTRLSMALNLFLDIIVIVTVDFTLSDPQSLLVGPSCLTLV